MCPSLIISNLMTDRNARKEFELAARRIVRRILRMEGRDASTLNRLVFSELRKLREKADRASKSDESTVKAVARKISDNFVSELASRRRNLTEQVVCGTYETEVFERETVFSEHNCELPKQTSEVVWGL